MRKSITVFSVLLIIILFSSCKKTDLTASYIYIDASSFSIDMTGFNDEFSTGYDQGELECIASQNFPDAWVMVNGKDLGTWELPCKIPVLAKENATVQIFPGVKLNGVSTSRPRYPFTDANKQTINLKPSEITKISSIPVKYYSTTAFKVVENFERDYNGYFAAEDSNGVNFEHIYDMDNPTNRIGMISLEDSVMDFNVHTSALRFNSDVQYVFLEMDYRCDVENAQIYAGVLITKPTTVVATDEPLVVVNASPKWKKIYINLTQAVLRNHISEAVSYRVYLSGGRSDSTPIHYYFDNIKVVYR
ncbi:MAG: hypothetical protein IJT61_05255 [Bacteroidales bacterium]|nr:hypothetical protein [Bacteroidales bacterium]